MGEVGEARRASCLCWLAVAAWMGLKFVPVPEALLRTPPVSLEFTDRHGQPLRETRVGERFRREVAYREVPANVIHAMLAAEDKRFFSHSGVDWLAAGRARADERARGAEDFGGVHDFAAAHQALGAEAADLDDEGDRDGDGAAAGAALDEGGNPRGVFEPVGFREPELRHRGGGELLLWQAAVGSEQRGGGAARGAAVESRRG